jgi:tRNA (cytidine32/uridine32-2'-O)-methyltransferase
VQIPANPDYSSLNLAMAVQTLSYEVRMSYLSEVAAQESEQFSKSENAELNNEEDEYPVVEETERFYQHFEQALKMTGFIMPSHPGLVMTKLRRLFNRARPDVKEVKMMRGILASVERCAKNKD